MIESRLATHPLLTALARIVAGVAAVALLNAQVASAQLCPGDCSSDLVVTVDEIVKCVNIGLGSSDVGTCRSCDPSGDQRVTVDEIIRSVVAALGNFRFTAEGNCVRPGTSGLVPCSPGTPVRMSRCNGRGSCLSGDITPLRADSIGGDGRFTMVVDGCQVAGSTVLFDSLVDAEEGTTYRWIDFGPAGGSGSGSGAGLTGIRLSPSSEAAVRLLDERGLGNFDDESVSTVIELVEQANDMTDFGGLSAEEAVELALMVARNDPPLRATVTARQFTPTPTPTSALSASPTPTLTPSRTSTSTPTITQTGTATLSPTITATPTPVLNLLFQAPREFGIDISSQSLAVANIGGNAAPDLVTAGAFNRLSLFINDGAATFAESGPFFVGSSVLWVATGDFNGDQVIDLAAANGDSHDVSVLLGNGGGAFQAQQRSATGTRPNSLLVARLNGDMQEDLVTTNQTSDDVTVLLGQGNGAFVPQPAIAVGIDPFHIAGGDLNRDSILDVATANSGSDDVGILIGRGDGTFELQSSMATGAMTDLGPSAIAIGDLNGDTWPDIVTANFFAANVTVLLNNQNGTYSTATAVTVGNSPRGIALADLSADGILDLIVANRESESVSTALGLGNGTFRPVQSFTVGEGPAQVVVADFNVDGVPDLATVNFNSNNVTMLLGMR